MSPPAGYSGTPLARKLGLKPGSTVGLDGAPDGFTDLLDDPPGSLPDDVAFRTGARGRADLFVHFTTSRRRFEDRLPVLLRKMDRDGAVWVAWPKRASGVPTDMTEDVVREVVLPMGLVDTKVCAIDDTWSGLRVCWRRENR